jgi:Protein of unknown function (DUF2874).
MSPAQEDEDMRKRNLTAVTTVVVSLGLSLYGVVFGQDGERRVKMKDLPEAVRKTVQDQSQGATIKGFSKEVEHGQTYYEVEMKAKGHGKDVLIDSTGAVVEVEEEVALAALPPDVRVTIEQNARGGKVLKVESISKNNSIVMYEALIRKAGKPSEIKVAPDGKLMLKDK